MPKSILIKRIADKETRLSNKVVTEVITEILNYIIESLARGEHMEVRGFGSLKLRYRAQRYARNPKTGESVKMNCKYVPFFKPGKELREAIK
ncbi:HU family DNA-binding protein [Candidatus Fukatsuia anoeciicola]|uniref:HU family DNA-binding protein n=1 Tax=Candidatus Fukatsuia anoeciicola TaxID=2994492 RepID=UPI003464BC66